MRVALVEDHDVLSEAMRISLSNSDLELSIVPLPDEPLPEQLVRDVVRLQPDLVLLDLDLGPAGDGAVLISPLREAGCRVLVLTASRDSARWGECLDRGALAVMSKGDTLSTMVDTMQAAARGLPAIGRLEREQLITQFYERRSDRRDGAALVGRLTRRERQVLRALMAGHRVAEIAASSHVSEGTVRTQVKSILAKLQVNSQIAAIALAREAGLEPAPLTDRDLPNAPRAQSRGRLAHSNPSSWGCQ